MCIRDSASPTRREAENQAAALPPLLLAAERIAASVQQGFHDLRQTGPGERFWQYRLYRPGDPPGRIDWRQSARGDIWQVRLQERQAAQSVWLWRDASSSMRFSGHANRPDKRYRAELLLLAIACLLLRSGERVGLLGSPCPPGGGQAVLGRLAAALASQSGDAALDTAPLPQPLARHSRALLFGDFLGDPAAIGASMKAYAAQGVRGALVQILDVDEVTLPYRGRVRFVGLENEGALVVARSETLRSAYRQRLSAHQAALADLSRAVGWRMLIHSSDQPPLLALAALYRILAVQGDERSRRW